MFLVRRVHPNNLLQSSAKYSSLPLGHFTPPKIPKIPKIMPPKKRSIYSKFRDNDDDEPKVTKRTKTSSSSSSVVPSGKKLVDSEGNPYWELGGRLRRVTVSEFKGNQLISIREHYEKDGKVLPGKKGISLTVDQFNALLSVLPQLDGYLADQDVELTRPVYGGLAAAKEKEVEVEEEEEEPKGKEDEPEPEPEPEPEKEEEEEEEEREVKPKKKPAKAAKKKAEPRKRRKAKSPERVDMSDDE